MTVALDDVVLKEVEVFVDVVVSGRAVVVIDADELVLDAEETVLDTDVLVVIEVEDFDVVLKVEAVDEDEGVKLTLLDVSVGANAASGVRIVCVGMTVIVCAGVVTVVREITEDSGEKMAEVVGAGSEPKGCVR